MAVNMAAFTLTSAAYQDISGGYEKCTFRIPMVSQRNNVIRVHLGVSLPSVDTEAYDEFMAPQKLEDEWQLHFTELSSTDRLFVRAARDSVSLKAYRKT
jgi:hypothetical protein